MKTEIDKTLKDEMATRASGLMAREANLFITDDATLASGADIQKVIKTQIKKADETRKEYVGPLNAVVKKINADFKAMVEPLQRSSVSLGGKMTAYVREKDRLEQERQRKLAREAEERALKEAEELQAAGREGEAEIALEQGAMAVDLVKERKPAPVRGDYGSVASTRKTWTFELEDLYSVPYKYLLLDEAEIRSTIRIRVREYQEEAKRGGLSGKAIDVYVENKMKDFKISGIRIYQKVDAVVR